MYLVLITLAKYLVCITAFETYILFSVHFWFVNKNDVTTSLFVSLSYNPKLVHKRIFLMILKIAKYELIFAKTDFKILCLFLEFLCPVAIARTS